jgi:hypothetical protein
MSYSTTNIHRVTSIKVVAESIDGTYSKFVSTRFTFTTDDGGEITVTAFSNDFLSIEGAEFLNHVAQPVEAA